MKELVYDNYCTDGSELKRLMCENPDLPLMFAVMSPYEYDSFYTSDIHCYVGEYLSCENPYGNQLFIDRGDFEDEVRYLTRIDDEIEGEELDKKVLEMLDEYEPYWKKCIMVDVRG